MSNSRESAAAQEARLVAGLELASVMGMASSIIHPSMLGAFLTKPKTKARHEPHQGEKERLRRLKRMKGEKP